MGLACSAESKMDRMLTSSAKNRYNKDKLTQKVILLGAGESGKSTIFKQMRLVFGQGFTPEGRRRAKSSMIQMMMDILNELVHVDLFVLRETLEESEAEELKELEDEMFEVENQEMLDIFDREHREWIDDFPANRVEVVRTLWEDPATQHALTFRTWLMLPDNLNYFFENLETLLQADYEMTNDDILKLRVRTTGVTSEKFNVEGALLKVIDVGGQRNERRKWIDQFDDVEAILFITGISDYDMICFEDSKTNRMHESLRVWKEVINNIHLQDAMVVLFLNKFDLFEQKFKAGIPLTLAFPTYEGGDDIEAALKYIEKKHRKILGKSSKRDIIVHVTTATDTDQMKPIIAAVRHSALSRNLRDITF